MTPKSVSMQKGQQAGSDSRCVVVASDRLIWTKHSVQMGCWQHREVLILGG